jgi:hypothetical protein
MMADTVRTVPILVKVLFFSLLVILIAALGFYLTDRIQNKKKVKESSKYEALYTKVEKGITEINILGNGAVKEKKKVIIGESSGNVEEIAALDSQTGEEIGKISVVDFDMSGGRNSDRLLRVAVQIVQNESTKNIMPWYLKSAFDKKEKRIYTDEYVEKEDLYNLFSQGTTWIIEPLTKSITSPPAIINSDYFAFVERYYSSDDWKYLEESFNNDFKNYNSNKPIFINRLYYVSLSK